MYSNKLRKVIFLFLIICQTLTGFSAIEGTFFTTPLNNLPTLDPIQDQGPFEVNPGSQNIQLTGISDGGIGEKQELTVTAVSNNTSLIPHPDISYTSPDATGILTFTPVNDAHGTAVITVTVSDGEDIFERVFNITVNPPAVIKPTAPVATDASSITQTGFTANWNSVSGATGYKLDVSTSGDFNNFVSGFNNKDVSGTSEVVTGLSANTEYYYRVRALNEGGASDNSNVIKVTTKQVNPPTAPVATDASSITQTGFTANWNSVSGATGYKLDVSTSGDFNNFVSGFNNKDVSGTSEVVTGLSANTEYYYRVRAINAGGASSNSNRINVTTAQNAPAAPEATAATAVTQSGFTANWNSVSGATGYKLDVSTSGDFNSFVSGYNNKDVLGTSEVITGLSENSEYHYRLRAINAGGTSPNSNRITANTLAKPNNPPTLDPIANPAPINEGAGLQTVQLTGITSGGETSQSLTVTATASNPALITGLKVNYTSPSNSGSLTYTPATNTSGTSTITVTVNDGQDNNNTFSRSFTVEVKAAKKNPTLDPIPNQTVDTKNPVTQVIELENITAGEEDVQNLTISSKSDNQNIIPNPTVSYTYPSRNGELRYKPVKNAKGTANISVTVDNGNSVNNTFTRTFSINAILSNTAPTSGDKEITINENEEYTFKSTDFPFADEDGDAFGGIRITTLPSKGALKLNGSDVATNVLILPANITNLKYTPENNESGTPYTTFEFQVFDGIDYSSPSNLFTIHVNDVVETPAAPEATAATSVTQTGFTANWNSVSGATGYELDVSTASDFSSYVSGFNKKSVTGTSDAVTGLTANTEYHYRVRAVNTAGTSGFSNVIKVTTSQVSPPAAPEATAATSITQTGFTANWNSVSGATGYELDVSTTSDFSSYVSGFNKKAVSGTSQSVTGLSADTEYHYRVRAVNAGGSSGFSNVIKATTAQVSPPAAPEATAATSITQNGFTANWNSVSGATGYELDVSTASDFSSYVSGYNKKAVSGTSDDVTGLTANTEYYYRVRAVNSGGNSGFSNVIKATTAQVSPPAAPVATAASSVAEKSFTANWNAVSGAESYRLDVSTTSNFSSFVSGYENKPVTGTNDNITGLAANTQYHYRVRAVNVGGASPNSNIINVTTLQKENSPPTLDAIPDPDPILEDAGEQNIALSGISPGADDSETVTITATSNNTALIPNPTVNYTNPNATGSLTYTPQKDANGTAVITVTISDGSLTLNRTFTVKVTSVNDPPLFTIDRNEVSVEEGFESDEKVIVTPSPVPDDEKSQTVTYSLSPASVTFANVSINPLTGEVLIKSIAFQSGGQSFTITANDGQAENNTATRTFNLTVGPVNKAPSFTIDKELVEVNEDFNTTETIKVTPGTVHAGEENQKVTYSLSPASVDFANVSINATTGEVTISSIANRFGSQTFTITADDGQAVNNVATQDFELIVNPINDPPTLDAIDEPAPILQNSGEQTINLTGISPGPFENQNLTLFATSGNTALIPNSNISVQYTSPATTGTIKFTPLAGKSGTADITVTIFDNGSNTSPHKNNFSRTFKVTVTAVNIPPTIDEIADPEPLNEDAPKQDIILTGISPGPEQNQEVTITAISDNKELIPDPEVSYTNPQSTAVLSFTPVANRWGSATISVTVKDNGSGTSPNKNTTTQSFTIQVNEVNDAPTLDVIEDPVAIALNSGQQTIPLSGISAGPFENQVLNITATSSNTELIPNPTASYQSPNATGSLQYSPAAGASGSSVITVTIEDDGPDTAPHTNTITRTFTVVVNDQADISIREAVLGRNAMAAGENNSITTSIKNMGSIAIAATKLRYYLSSNSVYEDIDILLGEDNVNALASGEDITINNSIKIPAGTTAGNYNIIFYADAENVLEEFDEENNIKAISITIGDEFANVFASTTFPEYFTVGSSEVIGITTTESTNIEKVILHYRGITQETFLTKEIAGSGSTYNIPEPVTDHFDEIGLEYYFEVFPENSASQTSGVAYTYLSFPENGLPIPNLKNGTTVADYQIISIPLELANKTVQSTLEDDFGPYNKSQWRLFNYNNANIEYKEGFENLETGKGYWLINREPVSANTGAGTTVKVTKDEPFVIKLKQGWNQIGNPYNFNVSWNDVLIANDHPEGLEALKIFRQVFEESDVLPKFRGGFVFSDQELDLKIPVKKESSLNNGRLAKSNAVKDSESSWEVLFKINHNETSQTIGGFGMNEKASFGKDNFDEMALPSFNFLNNISISFKHPEYFYPDFAKDIVPVTDGYTWEFSLNHNVNGEMINLEWEKSLSENDHKIILLDLYEDRKIDLKTNAKYTFKSGDKRNFKIIYGSESYVNKEILSSDIKLGKAYPNPFKDFITIPFEIPLTIENAVIQLHVFDVTGKLVKSLPGKEYIYGFNTISWDGSDNAGRKCKPGIYIFHLNVSGEKVSRKLHGRMILN